MMAQILSRLADALMAAAQCVTPAERREWLEAMRGEYAQLGAPAEKLRWSAGSFAAAIRLAVGSRTGRFQGTCLALLVPITVHDWRSADPTLTLLLLVFVPGILAYANPARRWNIGLVFGLWLLIAHGLADLSGALRPHYQRMPLSAAELAEIALLVAIAVPAALLGARARRMRPRA